MISAQNTLSWHLRSLAAMLSGMAGQQQPEVKLPSLAEVLTPQVVVPLLQQEGVRNRLAELVQYLPQEHQAAAAQEVLEHLMSARMGSNTTVYMACQQRDSDTCPQANTYTCCMWTIHHQARFMPCICHSCLCMQPGSASVETWRSAPLLNQLRTLSAALQSGQLDYSQFGLQPLVTPSSLLAPHVLHLYFCRVQAPFC